MINCNVHSFPQLLCFIMYQVLINDSVLFIMLLYFLFLYQYHTALITIASSVLMPVESCTA